MGNSKKFYRKKQRNNKASKSRKERQHNEKNKAAAASASASASASVSEEKKNYDSHDLEIMVSLMASIADTFTNPKCRGLRDLNSANNLESWATLGIPNNPGVFIPKTETHSHDLRTMDKFGVSVVLTHNFLKYDGPPVVNSAGKVENWAAYGIPNSHGVFIPRTDPHTGSGDQNPPTISCDSRDLETIAGLGVCVVSTHKVCKYDGPPVKNSAGKLENWAAFGVPNSHGVFFPKEETHFGYDDQTPPATISCDSHDDLETMAPMGVSVVRTYNCYYKYDGPPVSNSAGKVENWAALGNPYIY